MFRGSMDGREFFAPLVTSREPADWPTAGNVSTTFWGFVAHAYKGYHYYTGSDFPADKPSTAKFARTDRELLVQVVMTEPMMAAAVEHCRTQRDGHFFADHVTVNLLTPAGDRFLFSVNPVGGRYCEKNLTTDAALDFSAEVRVHELSWEARFAIPFATIGIEPDAAGVLACDVVRQEQGDSAITTLTRAGVTPPYNFIYDYPVFHFSPLYLGEKCPLPPILCEDATAVTAVTVRRGARVRAGELSEVILEVTVGRHGLAPGARLKLRHAAPVLDCAVPWTRPLDWSNVQTDNPRGAGFLAITGAPFAIATNGVYTTATYAGRQPLASGRRFKIRIGDRRAGGPGIRAALVADAHHQVALNLDARANRLTEPLLPWPTIAVAANEAADLIISNPGAVPAGRPFEVCIRLVDRLGNLAEGFAGKVILHLDAADHDFPAAITFTPADRGAKIVAGVIRSRGVHSFAATAGRLSGQGNYLATDGSFGDGYLLYGDIHCHTCASDGWRTPAEKVHESRSLRGLNFMAIADHDFDMSPEKWADFRQLARTSDEPGRFATFLAYEWTPSAGHGKPFSRQHPGHYVVLFPEFDGELIRANEQHGNAPDKLFAAARQQGDLMVIPHYHGQRPPIAPDLSHALEIAAWDGKVAERDSDARHSVFSSLDEGWRVGLIAGTDHGGEGLTAYRNGEMFAVRVPEFTRDAIRDAIRHRRTIAIPHSRIALRFTINHVEMGDEIRLATADTPREISIRVASRPYAAKIELIRNGEVIRSHNNTGRDGSHELVACTFTDDQPLARDSWYLIRLMLHGGERIWSSPIWIVPDSGKDLDASHRNLAEATHGTGVTQGL